MAQRENNAADSDHGEREDEESSFLAAARDVIERREDLLDALDE